MPSLRPSSSRRSPGLPVELEKNVSLESVLAKLRERGRSCDEAFLRSVYDFTAEMHGDQTRRSGEPYLTHPVYVSYILADLHFDQTCVAVGLLHDVIEDTLTTREVLAEKFGDDIAQLVDGVTKIGRHAYVRRDESQAETFRKLLLASAEDIRVIVVKLADRLHNMMTLEHMSADAQRRIAQETLEIYSPTAHRLGMSRVQGELEDLAFFYLYPRQYAEVDKSIQERVRHGKRESEKIRKSLASHLKEGGISAEINWRVKRFYSIYRKMRRQGIDASQLYDCLAYRIVTDSVKSCYGALGVVHQAWRPVPGRFKDYIAMPKPNLYQSLHTTVVGGAGQPFEVQIRTQDMDLVAEEGIAAHWHYKEGRDDPSKVDHNLSWLRQVLEWQKDVKDSRSFLNALKIDMYPDEVYVFSPNGDVFSFPRGATPLDFAYRIHTDLGHRCVGARINGKLMPLRTKLSNGDLVEIDTSASRKPSRDWLSFVATSRAKNKIRHWLNTEQKKSAVEVGRRVVEKEARRYKVSLKRVLESPEMGPFLTSEGLSGPEDLFAGVGFGKIQIRPVMSRLLGKERPSEPEPESKSPLRAISKLLPFGSSAIAVKGHGDMLVYLAKCCRPVPGEPILGYITRGKGVSVHSAECSNVQNLLYNPEREIEVEWARQSEGLYPVVLRIETRDQPGMLAKLTEAIAKHEGNIRHFSAETLEAGEGLIEVVVEVRNRKHLTKLSDSLRKVPGVEEVGRSMSARHRGER